MFANSNVKFKFWGRQAIDAFGVGRVVASGNPDFGKGDLVAGITSWGEYSIVKEGGILNKLDSMGFPLSYHVGVLGMLICYSNQIFFFCLL